MFEQFRKKENPIEKIRNVINDELRNFGFTPGEVTIQDKELAFTLTDISDEANHQLIVKHLYTLLVSGKDKLAADVFVIPHDETDYEIVVKLL